MLLKAGTNFKLPRRKINWARWVFTVAAVMITAAILLQSYLAFHKQVYTACRLSIEQGYDIPPPMRATCIQVGGNDGTVDHKAG